VRAASIKQEQVAMIKGVHTMFYTSEPEALRAFFRDKLGLPATEVGEGWLIFDLPDAEMGCHPAEKEGGQPVASGTPYISFYCDDIQKTMAELKQRGVEFDDEVIDAGYGLTTRCKVPGGFTIELYQPRYQRNSAAK
jgi:catechol 2,3-dioxygenase-like lactoylglutathione lyase family enzyme